MAALVSLLTVLTLSLLINRIATVLLTLTGLSRESARFQARSAFTGVGFTTREAEQVVNHPVRRRIVMFLMLLGNVGIVTSISSLLLTFINTVGPRVWLFRVLLLGSGLAILWLIASSKWVDRYLSQFIEWALRRWSRLDTRDYANLLHLSGKYTVLELEVQDDDWLAHQRLDDLNLLQEGIVVLGIERASGRYVGAPKSDTRIYPGDTLILYGRLPQLDELDSRRAGWLGDAAHEKAVREQEEVVAEQDSEEAAEGM
ncbi:MAG: TrkA C-terminal domain-containing protein [Elainellaceae cyanobacterium]